MDRHELPDSDSLSDDKASVLTAVAQVLWWSADSSELGDHRIRADDRIPFDRHVMTDFAAIPDDRLRTDNGIGAYADVVADLSAGFNDCGGMNHTFPLGFLISVQ